MFYSYNIYKKNVFFQSNKLSFHAVIISIIKSILKMDNILNFLSSNVNGLKSSKKRIKMFEYFREKISNSGIIFLQESHSSDDTFKKWRNDFKREVFFSHDSTSSYGVMIGYLGSKKIQLNKINKDDHDRILIIDANIDDEIFILINFYNANT